MAIRTDIPNPTPARRMAFHMHLRIDRRIFAALRTVLRWPADFREGVQS